MYVCDYEKGFDQPKRMKMKKKYLITISTFTKISIFQLLKCGYSKVYCHITYVLEVWQISYVVIGDK